ncbi:MAG TPA: hydrogenase maturation protease [Candidatus Limnocylindrales bacterium]|nr:hydrogenase maturation protease [Candidatus Limnocylindrales bacterium]
MSSGATAEPNPTTLVVGLGNPILGDDGVGWRVVEALGDRLADDAARRAAGDVELDRVAVGGLSLMERLVGYDRVVLVDAVLGADRPGTVSIGSLAETTCRLAGHLDSAHDVPLTEALSAGRALGAHLPDDITVIGVAVRRVDVFDEALSPEVGAALDTAVDGILTVLDRRPVSVA